MALRRELLLVMVASFLLLGPGQALAAPTWLGAEPLDSTVNATIPADVAADAGGNAVAVWLAEGQVRASYRPRGGPWGAPENLDPGAGVNATQPRVTVQPNGEFVAVWVIDGGGSSLRWTRRPSGGDWSEPDTVTGISSPPAVGALEASADGSVTVMTLDEGFGSTNTKPAGSEEWGPDEDPSLPQQDPRLAVAPDGSAVAVGSGNCGTVASVPCLVAAFRPSGGPWGPVEPVAAFASGRFDTGFEVAATPASSFTVVWGEAPSEGSSGSVRSADREPGADGGWAAPETIVDVADAIPGCGSFGNCFDVVTGPDSRQLAAWQESGATANVIVAAQRPPGDAWGSPETAGPVDSSAAVPFAALTAAEVPVLAWGSAVPGEGVARGAHRDAAGWQPVTLADGSSGGPPPENGVYLGDLVADGEGNALTAWEDPSGVDASGFDGAGPRFSAFSLPSGPAGQALGFSAAADDNWSGVAGISWLFGDGAGAPDATTSHAYGAPGEYTATATATDGVGNETPRSGTVSVGPAPTPTPDPCGTADADKDGIKDGCDDNNGARRPVAFKTVNATVVSGDVFVKLPAGAARAAQGAKPPKGFVRLEGAETIPVGSTLDTAKGRVRLRTAADTRKHVQTADFFRGRFVVRQVRKPRGKAKKRSTKLITDIILNGSSFRRACRTTTASVSQKRRRSKKRVRRLFGDGKGSFRTRGRNAAATVRGTRWSVQDRCDGTLVTVQRGRVEVRDLVRRKTAVVRTGQTYLARRR